jgi:hypothetical protein
VCAAVPGVCCGEGSQGRGCTPRARWMMESLLSSSSCIFLSGPCLFFLKCFRRSLLSVY